MIPDVTKEEFLEAIRRGVRDAIWDIATNATSMPCADFYEHIKEGVALGIQRTGVRPARAPQGRPPR